MINDKTISDLYYRNGKFAKAYYKSVWLDKNPKIKEYVLNRYADSTSYKESVYRIVKGIENRPVCVHCGKPVIYTRGHFLDYCCKSCMEQDPVTVQKREQTMLDRFGVKNAMQSNELRNKATQTTYEKYGAEHPIQSPTIKEKTEATNLKRYGNKSVLSVKSIRDKGVETSITKYGVSHPKKSKVVQDKTKNTNLLKYGCENVFQNEDIKNKIKETLLSKFGVEHTSQLEYVKNKIDTTKRKNNTFNTSSKEEKFEEILIENDIRYNKHYKNEEYPFRCDFYIIDLSLYVELNYYWSHGKHRFDHDNPDDITRLNVMKSKNTQIYNNAIHVWTITDKLKIQTAINNKLNYLAVYGGTDVDYILPIIQREFTTGTKNKQLFIGEK